MKRVATNLYDSEHYPWVCFLMGPAVKGRCEILDIATDPDDSMRGRAFHYPPIGISKGDLFFHGWFKGRTEEPPF